MNTCPNCSTDLSGKYCHGCGQKLIEPDERTLKHMVIQFFGAAFFLENSFLRNLCVLFSKPGLQTIDFIEGRRKRWMNPFSLFLLINLAFFIINPASDFSLSLEDHVNLQVHSPLVAPLVADRLKIRNSSFGEYAVSYKRQSDTLSKTLIIINVPFSALFFSLWFFRRKMFFADHFVFFLYTYAFLLLAAVVLYVLLVTYSWAGGPLSWQWVPPVTIIGLIFYYLFSALRCTYYPKRIWSTFITVFYSFFVMAITHLVYRFVLFMITFWTT